MKSSLKSTNRKPVINLSFILMLIVGISFSGCADEAPDGPDTGDALHVISTSPQANADDVPIDIVIEAAFNAELKAASVNENTFMLVHDDTNTVNGTVSFSANTATFRPSSNLMTGTEYIAIITTEAENIFGVTLDENYEWHFTTTTGTNTTGSSDSFF